MVLESISAAEANVVAHLKKHGAYYWLIQISQVTVG
jgi:hypothetical protein